MIKFTTPEMTSAHNMYLESDISWKEPKLFRQVNKKAQLLDFDAILCCEVCHYLGTVTLHSVATKSYSNSVLTLLQRLELESPLLLRLYFRGSLLRHTYL